MTARIFLPLLQIYQAALAAVDPERGVGRALRELEELDSFERVWVVGAGKATPSMARAAEAHLGSRLAGGLLITKHGHLDPHHHSRLAFKEAGHPLPDQASLDATRALLHLLAQVGEDDLVVVLLSGGGSTLLELPQPGVSLEDLRAAQQLLLHSGAPIHEINLVRRHLSQVKGGQLLTHIPGQAVSLILSDVLGGDPSLVASGPTLAGRSTPAQARAVLERFGLWERVPESVRQGLADLPPVPDHPWWVLGDNRQMAGAAVDRARHLGLDARLLTAFVEGEAREVGRFLAGMAREMRWQGRPGVLVLSGEPTVTVRGSGRGGRCQELGLAFALSAAGLTGVQLLAGSSDGQDGPTEAAGALVDGQTCERARERGLDPQAYLSNNDSYGFFEALGESWVTGPSGTNTNDLLVMKVD